MATITSLFLCPFFWPAKGVWLAQPISDMAFFVVAGVLVYRQVRNLMGPGLVPDGEVSVGGI